MLLQKNGDTENPNPKPMLLIAFTPLTVKEDIKMDFKLKSFEDMLTNVYRDMDETEEKNRSIRFCRKLKRRVWGNENSRMTKESRNIAYALKADIRKVQNITNVKRFSKVAVFSLHRELCKFTCSFNWIRT